MLTRIIALLLVAAGIALALLYRDIIDPVAVRDAIAGNPFSPAIFVALQLAASLLFIPRTVLGIAAGLVFGFVWGTVWALTGAMLGAAAGFALTRWLGAGGMLDTSPGIGRLVQRADGYVATIVSGVVTQRGGQATGELPGRLLMTGISGTFPG